MCYCISCMISSPSIQAEGIEQAYSYSRFLCAPGQELHSLSLQNTVSLVIIIIVKYHKIL